MLGFAWGTLEDWQRTCGVIRFREARGVAKRPLFPFNGQMDANGSDELRRRIEQQQHWRQAEAVRDGRQAATDPDADALTELGEGIRIYGSERVTRLVHGEAALVTETFAKRLVDGWWHGEVLEQSGLAGAA